MRWSNVARSTLPEEVVADKFATRRRTRCLEHGLCLEHGSKVDPSGGCPDYELQQAIPGGATAVRARVSWKSCRADPAVSLFFIFRPPLPAHLHGLPSKFDHP